MLTSVNVHRFAPPDSNSVRSSVKRKKILIGLIAFVLITLATDQAIQYGALTDGYFLGRRIAPYDPPLLHAGQEHRYDDLNSHLESAGETPAQFNLDPEIGWCPKPGAGNALGNYDWSGSRIGFGPLPREKSDGIRRILAIGCSFTRGDEVADEETWPAQIDRDRADLEIANMGVGGYGMDQALLRLRREGWKVEPDEVWLGFMPWAAPRLTNMYRPALRRWTNSPAFKPRFALAESGDLQLIENPARTLAEAAELLSQSGAILRDTQATRRAYSRFRKLLAPARFALDASLKLCAVRDDVSRVRARSDSRIARAKRFGTAPIDARGLAHGSKRSRSARALAFDS